VGTSSLRRQAQLKALRPDLTVRPLRGNVDTRLGKLATGEYDAIVLAAAGLTRLGRNGLLRQSFPVEAMCPAAGQGALAVEIRYGDVPVREAVSSLDDPSSRLETDCERALLRGLGGGCQVPIGANARLQNEALELRGVIVKPDGSELLWETGVGQDALLLGRRIAENLLRRGGAGILQLVYGQAVGLPGQP
jgi:hydroxymethylbilane synthase